MHKNLNNCLETLEKVPKIAQNRGKFSEKLEKYFKIAGKNEKFTKTTFTVLKLPHNHGKSF